MFSAMWNKIKSWSGWSTAGSIFIARLETFTGFITGVVGMLDWSPILAAANVDTGLSRATVISLGGVMFVKGILAEVTRRYNAKFNS